MTAEPGDPRSPGVFPVSPALAQTLADLRAAEGVHEPPGVDADAVHAVEVGVGYRFPFELLAVYAARVPTLRERHEFTLDHVVAHTGALRHAKAPGDLVGLGRFGGGILAVSMRLDRPPVSLLRFCLETKKAEPPTSLEEWLLSFRSGKSAARASFVPRLTRVLPGGSSGRPVRHPVFGDGRVFLESGSGPTRRVKVDFPKVGLKVIQARFLTFLDEPSR